MPPIYLTSDLLSYKRKPNLFNPLKITTAEDGYANDILFYIKGDGESVIDLMGNSLTIQGTVSTSATKSKYGGKSVYFGSNDNQITIPTITIPAGEEYTIECWLNCDNVGDLYQHIFSGTAGAGISGGNRMMISSSTLQNYTTMTHQTSLSSNVWYHVALVGKNNSHDFYLNGIKNTTTRTYTGATSITWIGNYNNVGQKFRGYMDSLRISSAARYTANFDPETDTYLAY